jgi:hypothetical protein
VSSPPNRVTPSATLALTCRWRSRPQHQEQTLAKATPRALFPGGALGPFVRVQLTAPTASASAQSGRPFSAARREAEVQSYSSATKSAAHRPLRLVKMA